MYSSIEYLLCAAGLSSHLFNSRTLLNPTRPSKPSVGQPLP